MGILRKAWDYSGWVIGAYTIYKQLQSMQQAKTDLYNTLSPAEQAEWNSVFGNPLAAIGVTSPAMPPVVQAPVTTTAAAAVASSVAPASVIATAAHLVAGT